MDLERFLDSSEQVATGDLDWAAARSHGLTPDEIFVLTYFADIEGQTIVYLRDLLKTKAALEPEVMGFLSMWNYEEYFHGRALSRLLAETGHPLGGDRIADVRGRAQVSEALEAAGASLLSLFCRDEFPAVYMAWGATQELTTLHGYEQIARATSNGVLRELAMRIARQERRHFAFYFNGARERLSASRRARTLTRFLLARFWSPVGAGVKPPENVSRMIDVLFGGAAQIVAGIDAQIGRLPGLEGIELLRAYVAAPSRLAMRTLAA